MQSERGSGSSPALKQGASAAIRDSESALIALLRAGAALDQGGRANQEDALGLFLPGEETQARRGSLFVLADGLGGHAGGEVASRLAVRVISTTFYASPLRQPENLLQAAIEQANRQIFAAGQDARLRGLGSTCVCAVVQGAALWAANVGDSRAYLLRAATGIQQLSQDHSLAAEQVRLGQLPSLDDADPALHAVLLQSLGMPNNAQPAIVGPLPLQKGDLVLLCSDGLYGPLDPRAMEDYLRAALLSTLTIDPDQLARDLVEGARFRGAPDNISALVIYCADLLPETVARAAGWPERDARQLILPGSGPGGPAALPAAPAPSSAGAAPAHAAAPVPAPPGGPGPPSPLRPAPGPSAHLAAPDDRRPGSGRLPLLTAILLTLALAVLAVLAVAWLVAALIQPALLPAIFLTALVLALPTGLLLVANRARLPLLREAGAPPAAPERGLPDQGGLPASADDPIALVIAQLLSPRASAAPSRDRGLPGPPPDTAGADPVSVAMSAALARARQQWTFNLLVAAASACLVLGGCLLTGITWLLGHGGLLEALFGPGLGILGILGWLVTQPAAQLTRAGTQISLLSIVWVNYAQELKTCARLGDPAATAACSERAAAQAVGYFNQIIGGPAK
ncbi:MAG TPA: protein phosphatase 2C domain-containing protein [Chloroflexia bacterium]|nr:protein phosphatase 2C domain-containing protein [Chloroflexia bacterium]